MTSNPNKTLAHLVWDNKYRYRRDGIPLEQALDDTWQRVATALSALEGDQQEYWRQCFLALLRSQDFLPGGRIIAGAGTGQPVTLFNCFVMGAPVDNPQGIRSNLQECTRTLEQGGGIGVDFSGLAARGTALPGNHRAAGPVHYLQEWNQICTGLTSGRHRRCAMMATLSCDHPDINAFIDAKQVPGSLSHFNLSVLITDAFMAALQKDNRAQQLWRRIMEANYRYAEPGVLFIDRINHLNPLAYCEKIHTTNPCGEVPLPEYGACDLGSINLANLVREPFTSHAHIDYPRLQDVVTTAVRLLDNVIDISGFPLPQQRAMAQRSRRIGVGVMGLADMLVMLGLHYASGPARHTAAEVMQTIRHTAYIASTGIAAQKGSFPDFDCTKYLDTEHGRKLPPEVREQIAQHGLRNSHLTAIAPTGSISLLAGNISSGIEPLYGLRYHHRSVQDNNSMIPVTACALQAWLDAGRREQPLPASFVTAHDLSPKDHLLMVAALQPFVDSAISKTINVPASLSFDQFMDIYQQAYTLGLKGCTTFRQVPGTPSVLCSP